MKSEMNAGLFATNVNVCKHPLVAHKLSQIRAKDTCPKDFREIAREIGTFLGYEAMADLTLQSTGQQQAHLAQYEGIKIKERLAFIPIMRAGLGLVDGMLDLFPSASVRHLGIFREKTTLQPVEYYSKLPSECNADVCIVLDPMIATAGTSIAAISMLKDWGAKKIKLVCICASKPGLEALLKAHPDLIVHVAAIDDKLNANGYIVPGMGDAGDRLFNTCDH